MLLLLHLLIPHVELIAAQVCLLRWCAHLFPLSSYVVLPDLSLPRSYCKQRSGFKGVKLLRCGQSSIGKANESVQSTLLVIEITTSRLDRSNIVEI